MSLTLQEGRDCLLLCGISKEGHIGMEMLIPFQFSAALVRLLNYNVFNYLTALPQLQNLHRILMAEKEEL